jgi:hypothetical protein
MAYDKTAIWSQIDAALGTGLDATGPAFNTLLKNVYESLELLISNEATNRSNGDLDLADLIVDEAALRVENDNLEIAARADAVNAESTARQDMDEYFDALRVAGDAAIQAVLDTLEYTIVGVATPSTDPGMPVDGKKAWFASTNGDYPSFKDGDGFAYRVANELAMFLVSGEIVIKCTLKTF